MDVLGVGNYSHGRFLSMSATSCTLRNHDHRHEFHRYEMKLPSAKWILPMFARAPLYVREMNISQCFETLVVGHVLGSASCFMMFIQLCIFVNLAAAYGDAWFLALRGAVAQRFREYYARAIMCGVGGANEYSTSELCTGSAPLLKGKQHDAHQINLYKKVGGLNGPVWEHLCR